jgi:hypothetical protein
VSDAGSSSVGRVCRVVMKRSIVLVTVEINGSRSTEDTWR